MNLTYCNNTSELVHINEQPLWKDYTFHDFGLALSGAFGLLAVIVSFYSIIQHATHYLKPWEQKHIIRILFMVPIYSIVSFLSYVFYRHVVYFEVIRDCYEAFAISSFFSLLCHYVAPDLHAQKEYFRKLKPRKWVIPLGKVRVPRSGLTWFNIIWFLVFQYCFIRVFMTIVSVIAQATGRYCLDSLSPAFAHVWVSVIEAICVTFAMYGIVQLYVQIRTDLEEYSLARKLLAIKLVIFLSFWQNIIISFLTSSGAIKESPTLAMPDVKVGIPALLLCIEMAIFSFLHIWAYPFKPYNVRQADITEAGAGYPLDPKREYRGGFLGIKAYADAFNPWDIIKAIARGFKWLIIGRRYREQDVSYQEYHLAQKKGDDGKVDDGSVTIMPGKYQPLNDDDDDNDPRAVGGNRFSYSQKKQQQQQQQLYGDGPHPSVEGEFHDDAYGAGPTTLHRPTQAASTYPRPSEDDEGFRLQSTQAPQSSRVGGGRGGQDMYADTSYHGAAPAELYGGPGAAGGGAGGAGHYDIPDSTSYGQAR